MELSTITSQFLIWSNSIITSLGYFGIFIVSFVGSASIFLPVPAFILVFLTGRFLNPLLVGFFAAIGCAFGELTGYGIGIGGRKIIEKKYRVFLQKYKKWFKRKFIFPIIILFAATPLPDDIVGILCGVFKYDLRKFFIASFIGKFILNTALAFGGYYGIEWILTVLGGA
jgi:membrane protein YqaA with SNARE-associated domain